MKKGNISIIIIVVIVIIGMMLINGYNGLVTKQENIESMASNLDVMLRSEERRVGKECGS